MNHEETLKAITIASDNGLLVRGVRRGMGDADSTLYIFDPLRNQAFYISTWDKLMRHLADNTNMLRTPVTQPTHRPRKRAVSA